MHLSADGKILYTGGQSSKGLYEKALIRTISLDFDQPNYWSLLKENYSSRSYIPASMTVDGKPYDSVGVRFKGLTSYRRTSDSQKKSFNISLDYQHENQGLMGYKTLNLNNAFDDPSFLREVLYLELIRNHIPAAKANFVNLEINGESWGLYPNIQQLNSDFIEEWFLSNMGTRWRADSPRGVEKSKGRGWGDGTAGLNYLGPDSAPYKLYYTLKKSNKSDPWKELISTCDVLENTPLEDLESVLAEYLDIDRTLWFLASEILFTDDDSYVFKGKMDYYLYWEVETGRMTPIEYDGNNAMDTRKVSWSPFYNSSNANYPLLNRLLSVPTLRQRYLAHVRTLIKEVLQPQQASHLIDEYVSMIDSFIKADNKKAISYNQFLSNIQALKRFFIDRYSFLSNHAEVNQIGPMISDVSYTPANGSKSSPRSREGVNVQAMITADPGVAGATLHFATGLVGNFSTTPMFDDGQHNDTDAKDGIYGGEIPGFSHGGPIRFYIEAKAANRAATVSYLPEGAEHNVFFYQVRRNKVKRKTVVINEIMANNEQSIADEAGEFDDWIELYNLTKQAIDLGGYYLSDLATNPMKWMIPEDTKIPALGYLTIWADGDINQGNLHANFKLSASGETLSLLNPHGQISDQLSFTDQPADQGYARIPNGTGDFTNQDPTFAENNGTTHTLEP